jgi:hypothetical protein
LSNAVHNAHDFHPRIPSRCMSPPSHSWSCISFISSCACVHDSRPKRRRARLLANPCDHLTLMILQNSGNP